MSQIVATNSAHRQLSSFERLSPSIQAHVLSFVSPAHMACVSRSFAKGVRLDRQNEWKKITVFTKEMELNAVLPFFREIAEVFAQIPKPVDLRSIEYRRWTTAQEILINFENLQTGNDPSLRLHCLSSIVNYLLRGTEESQTYKQYRALHLKVSNAELNCMKRRNLASLVRNLGLVDFDPIRFKQLHFAQLMLVQHEVGSAQATKHARFRLPTDGTYSLESFLKREEQRSEMYWDLRDDVWLMWVGNGDAHSGLQNALLANGILEVADLKNTSWIELWMRGHRAALDQITYLHVGECGLRTIPPILWQELHHLSHLELRRNPITTFPEEAYNHFSSYSLAIFCGDALSRCTITHENLRTIPFRMWLSSFTVTTPVFLWDRVLSYITRHALEPLNQWLLAHIGCLTYVLHVPAIVLALATYIPFIVLSIPFFLYNALVALVIAPLITELRDLSGFGRMIER